MRFKHQKQNQLHPPQQDSAVPSLPFKQIPWQPNPGLSGTQQLEDLFRSEKPKIPLLISTFDSSELTLTPFVEPSQPDEPRIPGPSQPSEPHEDALTCEPEPEVAPTQSMEEPFVCPATPAFVIIIDNTPVGSPPVPSSPQSHDEARQESTDLQLTLMIP
ncbi:hypothetical protein O181_012565 [Austropuccinia psidii MF-1]|uniref:Uncharacterized protein n=1 Tax=Austropuccinia psidii MF-1 TaxID=1389203 RepID=A0A9Q3BXB7_9BASI|nr:hypothetical protein [Austropuccinia psidii MF-1]